MAVKSQTLRIGTRGSPLALAQADMVRAALTVRHAALQPEIIVIKTSGDWRPEEGEARLVEEQGGKGQFAKEIEEALLSGAVDIGVHSMKDMETVLPTGLGISCMLPREDARDALLVSGRAAGAGSIAGLPPGITVGTASVRRMAFLKVLRPDVDVVPLRGNVETRIQKLRSGRVDATFLALAGLKRLGLEREADIVLAPDDMLPAAGQGAVGIEIRSEDARVRDLIAPLNCIKTLLAVTAERAVLAALDGSCHTPIGAYAVFEKESLRLRAMIAALDGSEHHDIARAQTVRSVEDAQAFGRELGADLKARVPAALLRQKAAP
jgi:hydroxymethylbilane synthase